MSIFVDTNILLRSIQSGHPLQDMAVKTISALLAGGEMLVITPQVIAEFWNVVTRPLDRNGFGLSVEQAQAELQQIESSLRSLVKLGKCTKSGSESSLFIESAAFRYTTRGW
jgi:predicted nucleic acid-binding protein